MGMSVNPESSPSQKLIKVAANVFIFSLSVLTWRFFSERSRTHQLDVISQTGEGEAGDDEDEDEEAELPGALAEGEDDGLETARVAGELEYSGQLEDTEDLENSLKVVLLTIGPSQVVLFVLQRHPEFYILQGRHYRTSRSTQDLSGNIYIGQDCQHIYQIHPALQKLLLGR